MQGMQSAPDIFFNQIHETVASKRSAGKRCLHQVSGPIRLFAFPEIILPIIDTTRKIISAFGNQDVGSTVNMRLRARPWIFPCFLHKTRTDRIVFDIPDGPVGMDIVQHARVEPALPQMSPPFEPRVEILRITVMRMVKGVCQRIKLVRYRDKMDVIAHQAPSPKDNPIFTAIFGQPFQVFMPVPSRDKHILLIISSLDNVVRKSRNYHSSHPWHATNLAPYRPE